MPSGSFADRQPPEMPSDSFDGQQPQMPGEMQQPGQQTTLSSTDSATEVVSGTMTNSAASLEADYDNATYITVTDDDSQVTIKSSGTYVVTGSSSDGNITLSRSEKRRCCSADSAPPLGILGNCNRTAQARHYSDPGQPALHHT